MLKLFQSMFGVAQTQGRYPESLVEMAIERAVDGTDPRLRALPGYAKRLRDPVVHAIDHVVDLVGTLPPPLVAGREGYRADPRLSVLFASFEHMMEVFSRDATISGFLDGLDHSADRITVLLLTERVEKTILGMELVGESVRRDVAQTSVSFGGHRFVDPMTSEEETRRFLMRRAFDHLLTLALVRIVERREERTDLVRQRELLKRKLGNLNRTGWGFEESTTPELPEASDLLSELDEIERQIKEIGTDDEVLYAHLDIVSEVLSAAQQQLWVESLHMNLDSMNIKRDEHDESAMSIALQELHNAQGRRLVTMLVSFVPGELPKRESFASMAQRYL